LIALFRQRQKAAFPLNGNNRQSILHPHNVMAVSPLARNKNLNQLSRLGIKALLNIRIISGITKIPPIIIDQVD